MDTTDKEKDVKISETCIMIQNDKLSRMELEHMLENPFVERIDYHNGAKNRGQAKCASLRFAYLVVRRM